MTALNAEAKKKTVVKVEEPVPGQKAKLKIYYEEV
jgi:hypothetical protein